MKMYINLSILMSYAMNIIKNIMLARSYKCSFPLVRETFYKRAQQELRNILLGITKGKWAGYILFLRDIDTSLSGLCSGKVFIFLMSGLKIRGFVSTGVQMSWDWPTLSTTKIVAARTTSLMRDLVLDWQIPAFIQTPVLAKSRIIRIVMLL